MKILVINQFGGAEEYDRGFVPRVGDRIDVFYEPLPTVTSVVLWPKIKRLKALGVKDFDIEALITVA